MGYFRFLKSVFVKEALFITEIRSMVPISSGYTQGKRCPYQVIVENRNYWKLVYIPTANIFPFSYYSNEPFGLGQTNTASRYLFV